MLDNVGHANDAQDRPIGPSSKLHKADLLFTSWVQEEPLALMLQATKVRSVRAAFGKGATWECDEETQAVDEVAGPPPRRRGRRQQERDERIDQLEDALTEEPQSIRALASQTGISKSAVQRLLDDVLLPEQRADHPAEGWVSHCPTSLGPGTPGHGQEELS